MSPGRGELLPGGYKVGEKVFYAGSNQTWDDGDKLAHGQQVWSVLNPGSPPPSWPQNEVKVLIDSGTSP